MPVALGASVAAVMVLEVSPAWSSLHSLLRSLDFDPARTALLQAWIAGLAVALLAACLSGRPWVSAFAAAVFVCVTYAVPWAWGATHAPTQPFGPPPEVDLGAFAHNLGVIAAVALLVAIPAAATGAVLRAGAVRLRPLGWAPQGLVATAITAALVLSALALAAGVDPLVRYGPNHGVYKAARAVPQGHLVYRTFHSRSTGARRTFAVYLPPGYDSKSPRRYPVVYLLHGDPGSYRDWVNLGAPEIMNNGIYSRALTPAILVIPDGNGPTGEASQWADSYDGRQRVESSVLELVKVTDRDYRTYGTPHERVVAGLSSGGYGAVNLAARHPEVFGNAVSLSGYFDARGPVFGGNRDYAAANSPTYLVSHQATARTVRYVLVVGKDDPTYRAAATSFAAELASHKVPHQLILLPGAHDSSVWTNGLARGLQKTLTPAPPPGLGADDGNPLSLGAFLAPLAALVGLDRRSSAQKGDPSRDARTPRMLRAITRRGGRFGLGAAGAVARGVITVAALADVLLAAEAWLTRHHATHSALALALAPLSPLRLLMFGGLATLALFMASRARRGFRYLLVGLAALGGILAITAEQPVLIVVALADCLLALLAGSLWPERGDLRSSLAGWGLLISATAVTAGLFMYQHPHHKLASFLTTALVMAVGAAVSGMTLLDRNAPLPNRSDPERARRLYDESAWAGVSPFTLVGRKRHFWAPDASAFLAYGCRAGVALALGPALGAPDAAAKLHERFRQACRRAGWRPALYQVSAAVTKDLGWGHRYLLGSEAIVDLAGLGLAGPERARLRHDVARGRRTGLAVELVEEADLDAATSRAMTDLARHNAGRRRLGEMAFSVGRRKDRCLVRRTMGLARDQDGRLVAYTTWLWMEGAGMVVLDEVQRAPDAPPGTMDLLVWTCLERFQPDARMASLGLAPIAGSAQAARLARIEAGLRRMLGLQSIAPGLYSFKAKFGPTWEPRYLVVERWRDWPAVWVAVFRLHFPDVLRSWMRPRPATVPLPRSA